MLEKIKGDKFALSIAFLSILSISPNSYYAYIVAYGGNKSLLIQFQAILFATLLPFSILYYTLKKNERLSLFFAIIELSMSYIHFFTYNSEHNANINSTWVFIAKLIVPLSMPISVYFYVHTIESKTIKEVNNDYEKTKEIDNLKNHIKYENDKELPFLYEKPQKIKLASKKVKDDENQSKKKV